MAEAAERGCCLQAAGFGASWTDWLHRVPAVAVGLAGVAPRLVPSRGHPDLIPDASGLLFVPGLRTTFALPRGSAGHGFQNHQISLEGVSHILDLALRGFAREKFIRHARFTCDTLFSQTDVGPRRKAFAFGNHCHLSALLLGISIYGPTNSWNPGNFLNPQNYGARPALWSRPDISAATG